MRRYLLAILITLIGSQCFAETPAVEGLSLSEAPIKRHDMESVKRGAKFFAANCMSCHTMIYLRYNKLAEDAGITYDKMPINVKSWPYGVKPPDLSLETDVRGVDWVYTYLHSFYQDSTRPTGFNNLVVPNTAMPGIISAFQGDQVLVSGQVPSGIIYRDIKWYYMLKLTRQGAMTPEQFDAAMTDLVNFLAYAAEPYHAEQQRIGFWVLGFLAVLFVLMYLLKKEYWKDVKRHRED